MTRLKKQKKRPYVKQIQKKQSRHRLTQSRSWISCKWLIIKLNRKILSSTISLLQEDRKHLAKMILFNKSLVTHLPMMTMIKAIALTIEAHGKLVRVLMEIRITPFLTNKITKVVSPNSNKNFLSSKNRHRVNLKNRNSFL